MRDLMRTIRTLAWVALIAAIYQELKKPAADRTWNGRVAGLIPYDFRMPTLERIRTAYWDPSSDRIFTDKVIGVGWAVNIPALIRRLTSTAEQYADTSRTVRDEIQRRVPQMTGRRESDGNGHADR